MNVRRTTLLIAIVLAVGTGWLTLTYLSSLRPAQSQQRQVLVATQDIPARTQIRRRWSAPKPARKTPWSRMRSPIRVVPSDRSR